MTSLNLSDIYFLAWKMGLKTTYYLRTLGVSGVEKSTVSTTEFGSTHTRGQKIVSAAMASIETPEVQATVAEVVTAEPALSAEEMKAKLARVAAGEEVGICESCEG